MPSTIASLVTKICALFTPNHDPYLFRGLGVCGRTITIFSPNRAALRAVLTEQGIPLDDDRIKIEILETVVRPLAVTKAGVGKELPNAGTLGCVVKNRAGQRFAISTEHGFFDAWDKKKWDVQVKVGAQTDKLGVLKHRGDVRTATPGTTDAVLIEPSIALSSKPSCDGPKYLDQVVDSGMLRATNQTVTKCGSRTNLTAGKLCATEVCVDVDYTINGVSTILRLDHQLLVQSNGTRFASPGDSGSLVVLEDAEEIGKPLGILYAYTTDFRYYAVCPLDRVLDGLGSQLGEALSVVPFP